jgi:hypothetical protein
MLKRINNSVRTYAFSDYTIVVNISKMEGFLFREEETYFFPNATRLASLIHVLDLPPLNF